MAIAKSLQVKLDNAHLKYEVTKHPPAYTAQEIAGAQHAPGGQVLKSVIVRSGDEFMMCVLPSTHFVDFEKLQKCTKKKNLELANEEDLSTLFPDMELGAEPPTGDLFGIPTFTDVSVELEPVVYFNAGNHVEMVKMRTNDFIDLSNSKVTDFGRHI